MLLKLTGTNGLPIYLFNRPLAMHRQGSEQIVSEWTNVWIGATVVAVKETPEQIMQLMNEAAKEKQ